MILCNYFASNLIYFKRSYLYGSSAKSTHLPMSSSYTMQIFYPSFFLTWQRILSFLWCHRLFGLPFSPIRRKSFLLVTLYSHEVRSQNAFLCRRAFYISELLIQLLHQCNEVIYVKHFWSLILIAIFNFLLLLHLLGITFHKFYRFVAFGTYQQNK